MNKQENNKHQPRILKILHHPSSMEHRGRVKTWIGGLVCFGMERDDAVEWEAGEVGEVVMGCCSSCCCPWICWICWICCG